MEMCDSLTLDNIEGIWIYPEDNVTVFVSGKERLSISGSRQYEMIVVETPDCRISPGETIGIITAGASPGKFMVELFSERKGGILTKPRQCTASLSSDGETLLMKATSGKFRFRLNINPSVLLPKLWKSIFRIGASPANQQSEQGVAGMIKIYPSYDGNGSSRRKPRYL